MADEVKQTPQTQIVGQVHDQPVIGAYSAASGSSLSRDISKKVPYALLDKTNQLPKDADTLAVMDSGNRWLRELGMTSSDVLDFNKAWETDTYKKQRTNHEWRDSYGGKLAIRTFSRGIMGSVFFVAGQTMVSKALKEYAYDPTDSSRNSALTNNPLTHIARLFDKTLGKGIYTIALAVTGDKTKAKNAVTFRPTNDWVGYKGEKGRSYGHEGLAITFDFGLASLGDYMGREIAGLIDPNSEKKWMKDGHIDVPAATKALLKTMWVGTSKAMGEDYFAMAAGYPYVVRGTRNLISKFSPGFEHDSDRWANGGSFKVDDNGKIVGNYQLEGMTDLGLRFTAYNMFTKVFRDGYDKVANQAKHFWDGDRKIHMPHFDEPLTTSNILHKTGEAIGNTAKYLARTAIKMALIMIPSSAVFAFIRSAQSKDIGLAIHPEHGPVGVMKDGKWTPVYTEGRIRADGRRSEFPMDKNTAYVFQNGKSVNFGAFAPNRENGYEKRFDPFGQNVTWHDRFTNPVGRFCHDAGGVLTEALKPVGRLFKGDDLDVGRLAKRSQKFIDATYAYTPYFMMKTDFASTLLDKPTTDMAADRTINGAVHLNWGEFKAGLGEILHCIENRPFSDPDREKLAQKKMRTYTNQLWSNQDEIIAKEREDEYQQRMDAMLTLGKPVSMEDLSRPSFTDKVGKRRGEAANESYYAQNVTPMVSRKPEDYKKPEEEWKKQANSTWHDRALKDFKSNTSREGQTIN